MKIRYLQRGSSLLISIKDVFLYLQRDGALDEESSHRVHWLVCRKIYGSTSHQLKINEVDQPHEFMAIDIFDIFIWKERLLLVGWPILHKTPGSNFRLTAGYSELNGIFQTMDGAVWESPLFEELDVGLYKNLK